MRGARALGAAPRGVESFAVFFVAAAAYVLAGRQLVVHQHVVSSGTLDSLGRALMVWRDRPGKLAAIGFTPPPLPTVALLPAAAATSLVTTLKALPLTAAPLAAAALVLIDRLLARCGLPLPLRLALVVAVAFNPLWVLAATAEPPAALELALLALALYGLVSWLIARGPRHLLLAGAAFALLGLTNYVGFAVALAAAVLVGARLWASRATADEIEGSLLGFAAAPVYAITAWIVLGAAIAGSPFGWLHDIRGEGLGPLHGGALALVLVALAAAAWLFRAASPGLRPAVALGTAALVVGALAGAWSAMQRASAAPVERAFVAAVRTGRDQRADAPERAIAAAIRAAAPGDGRILADEAHCAGVIALTGRPALFVTRAAHGDRAWRAIAAHPQGRVSMVLVATRAPLPPGSDVVASAPGYALLRVPASG